ncbi:MAG: SpvB/TcaC N-terminal domain-containing protein, partial [Wenzhouxiangellaceae bacterium]
CGPDDRHTFGAYHALDRMHAVYPGFSPFFDGTEIEPSLDMPSFNQFADGSIGRKYADTHAPDMDARRGYICANLSLTQAQIGGREFSVGLGNGPCSSESSATQQIRKTASLHAIEYEIVQGNIGATSCNLDGAPFCKLNLTWFTNDAFPDAQPMFSEGGDGDLDALHHINSLCVEDATTSDFGFLERDYVCHIHNPGNYRFHLVNRPDASGSRTGPDSAIIASSKVLHVTGTPTASPADPPTISLPAVPAPTPGSASVGATRGEFRVGESGAASYRIGIMTAPSGGNMAPEIALRYNSQSGPGAAGIGWNIEGISTIGRCAKTYETDSENGGVTLSADDRFCLDGQRLMAINGGAYGGDGTEYRLEIDPIARIQSFGRLGDGPAYFKVWRKDGTIHWYGATESDGTDPHHARVSNKRSDALSPVWRWNIGRIEDSAGNYIRFEWNDLGTGDRVETVIARIGYGANTARPLLNPINEIVFNWDLAPEVDRNVGITAGALLSSTRRISSIRSLADGVELRNYALTYASASSTPYRPGRLISVQECRGTNCFPGTTFDWYSIEPALPAAQTGQAWDFEIPGPNNAHQLQLADLNGDGMEDLVYLDRQPVSSMTPRIKYFLARRDSAGGVRFSGTPLDGGALHASVPSTDFLPEIKLIDADG